VTRQLTSVPRVSERRQLPFDPIAEAMRQWESHGWAESASAMAIVTSVMRLQQVFLSQADRVLRPLGLTFARYEVLMLLSFSQRGSLPLGKISERLQVNAASVTNAVDRLEGRGLVIRQANPDDGRGTLAVLSESGRALALAATDVMNAGVFSELGVDDDLLRSLFGPLSQLRAAAGDYG
jgi:DNA-binding MarR family transcriptional regulator